MARDGVVESVDIASNGLRGFVAGVEDCPPNELGFDGLEERLENVASLCERAFKAVQSSVLSGVCLISLSTIGIKLCWWSSICIVHSMTLELPTPLALSSIP
jgi:hypothetical protein